MPDTDQPGPLPASSVNDPASLEHRLLRLESETVVLRAVTAHLVAGAAPQARVAVVRMLTGLPSDVAPILARSLEHDNVLKSVQRELLSLIAASAG